MPSSRALQAALICLLALGGCAIAPKDTQLNVLRAGGLPPAVELGDTPFIPQTAYHCGPAALATVLQAHDITVSPEALAEQVYLPGRKGSLQVEMIAATRRHHALPYVLETSFAGLLREVAAGNPVLVLQNLGLRWLPRWHYAVVVGYDINTEMLTLRSGTMKRRQTPFAVFKRTWQRAHNWALVVVPAGKVPATASPSAYLATAFAFEETGMAAQAAQAYRAATVRWPGQGDAWLMAGNMAYASKQTSRAISDYRQATKQSPNDVRAWNNLAYALREQGCEGLATKALQCALRIAPDDRNLQDSLRDFEEPVPGQESAACKQNASDILVCPSF